MKNNNNELINKKMAEKSEGRGGQTQDAYGEAGAYLDSSTLEKLLLRFVSGMSVLADPSEGPVLFPVVGTVSLDPDKGVTVEMYTPYFPEGKKTGSGEGRETSEKKDSENGPVAKAGRKESSPVSVSNSAPEDRKSDSGEENRKEESEGKGSDRIGAKVFRSGYIEAPEGETLEFGQCRPEIEKVLPPGKCGVYATSVFFEMLKDLCDIRKMISEILMMHSLTETGINDREMILHAVRSYNIEAAKKVDKWFDFVDKKD